GVPSRMLREPCLGVLGRVGGAVVEHEVDLLGRVDRLVEPIEEGCGSVRVVSSGWFVGFLVF
ncbi:MAG: hypothetical protein ACRDRL_01005, partial [Sciscionella sp.]